MLRCAEGSAGGPLVSAVLGGADPAQLIAAFSFFPHSAFFAVRLGCYFGQRVAREALVGLFLKWRKKRTRPIIFLGAGAVGSFLFWLFWEGAEGDARQVTLPLSFREHVSIGDCGLATALLSCLAEPCFFFLLCLLLARMPLSLFFFVLSSLLASWPAIQRFDVSCFAAQPQAPSEPNELASHHSSLSARTHATHRNHTTVIVTMMTGRREPSPAQPS